MATQVIDTALHLAAFPPGYTGPGTLIGNCVNSGGVVCDVYGFFTSSTGNDVRIDVGFKALQVDILDATGAIMWHWRWGMPANNTIKMTLGTIAGVVDTTGAIVVVAGLGGTGQVNLSQALCGNGKNICYRVQG